MCTFREDNQRGRRDGARRVLQDGAQAQQMPRSDRVARDMSTKKSLKPQLNQIRAWVQQGRTDAWIAHQLEVTVQQIDSFKREQGLTPEAPAGTEPGVDLRDADDALIAAELEAEQERAAEEAKKAEEEARAAAEARRAAGGNVLEGTFDHGEEGYGLWLDPAVADDPVYAEHWAGHRPVEVTIEEDQIIIRRSGD